MRFWAQGGWIAHFRTETEAKTGFKIEVEGISISWRLSTIYLDIFIGVATRCLSFLIPVESTSGFCPEAQVEIGHIVGSIGFQNDFKLGAKRLFIKL